MARAMLSEPAILVADEPTQGVDVGARAEIYRILREVAGRGVPVVVASCDAKELEGLCDRVIVMSRGQAVATLEGDDVTEERIIHAAVSATAHTAEQAARRAEPARRGSRASSRATTRRSWSSRWSCSRSASTSCRRTPATSRTSTSPRSCSRAPRSASSRWGRRSRCCSAASTSPSVRWPASSSCRVVLRPRRQVAGDLGARLRADVRGGGRRRARERRTDPIRASSPRWPRRSSPTSRSAA